ncbi:SLBB domain-containing protein [Gammaproteobacteria bacterium]|nr:SLBB domain-containing protein [Gammaproteobacteria bacterium]
MHKLIRFNFFFILTIFTFYSHAQEIDPSLLKNLSPEQIAIAKSELNKNKTITKPKPKVNESTIKQSITDINKVAGKKYGYGFFSSVPTSISAVGDLPIPNDYKISLNDQLTVILSGSKEAIFDLNVNLDGTILFPELGSINIVGEAFGDVKSKLRNLINQSYIGVQIDLSLKNLSAKKITIVGAVKTPGTYLVNPFSTISSSLAYSGGISEVGTLRNIKLIRNNGDIFSFDLYKLLIKGDRSDDITIESGDVILVNPAQQFIYINGQVKRPSIYEVNESETLADIIDFALGFTEIANKSNINVKTLDLKSGFINKINTSELSMSLKNILGIDVYNYVNKDYADISVGGAIKEPGYYSLDENPTLEKLINSLEFVDVYPWLGVLEQFDENNLIQSSILFSLKDPNTYKSINLLPNSKVYFANIGTRSFSAVDITTQRKIADFDLTINHRQSSYNFPVFGRFSVTSFTDLLGLDMSDIDMIATYVSPLESVVIKDDYRNMEFVAKKYNTITFRNPINDLIQVTISGQIEYPGTYTLELDATLQDLYELIGDFKSEAFTDGVIFTRASVRERQLRSIAKSKNDLNEGLLVSAQKGERIGDINIIRALSETIEPENIGRIAGDFSPNSISAINTVLFNGDRIIIPKNPNTINVLGEVLNPISFQYQQRMSVSKAIGQAGGFKEYAKRNAIYIIKANGITEKVNRNIFVRNQKLEPGDTIVVPRKIITNNPGIEALLPVTQILSDLAFSAAAIESLSNSN